MRLGLYLMPVFATAMLALAPAGSAIFMVTPLQLVADKPDGEVGDDVNFTASPTENGSADHFAGKDVIIRYTLHDNNGTAQDPRLLRDDLVLDDEGKLSFTWTIPADADDKNAFVTIERGEEVLATAHLAIGDAEPMLMAMSGEASGEDPEPRPEQRADEDHAEKVANVPGPGALLAIASVGLAAALVIVGRRA